MSIFIPDLTKNTSSVALTLSGSVGQSAVPDDVQRVGLYTSYTSGSLRCGFSIPQSASTVINGSATLSNLRTGIVVPPNAWNWYNFSFGQDRVLYFTISGSSTAIVNIVYA